jgi:hypothetical protein
VADAVARGLDLAATRQAVPLDTFATRFAGGDARSLALFTIGFTRPGIKRAFDEASYLAER